MHDYDTLLWGGYGWGNAGDELTLAVALRDIRTRQGENIAIISPHPEYSKALFPEIPVIPYCPIKRPLRSSRIADFLCGNPHVRHAITDQFSPATGISWAKAIRSSKQLYLVGGGYLNSLFDFESFLLPARVARHCGIRIETGPLGIGPFQRRSHVKLFKKSFADTLLHVRDTTSLNLCRNLGLRAEMRPDDGFRAAEIIPSLHEPTPKATCVGVNLHPQAGGTHVAAAEKWWNETLTALRQAQVPVEGFCFHNSPLADYTATTEAFAAAGLDPGSVRHPHIDFRDGCSQLKRYRAIITTRFHAVVVSSVIGIPALAAAEGPYYQEKMKAACASHPASRLADRQTMSPQKAAQWIEERFHARQSSS